MSEHFPIQWTDARGRKLGRLKQLAKSVGVPVEQYQQVREQGQKWCMHCRTWHHESMFALDRTRYDGLTSSCRASRNLASRTAYTPKPEPIRRGPLPHPCRDGDAKQARYKVNHAIERGRLPRPNHLPCTDCGHVWAPGERRHEYDHYLGYEGVHHFDVQPVCSACHHRREEVRNVR